MSERTVEIVCFTGHRPDKLGGYDERNETAEWVKARLLQAVRDAYWRGGARMFISGGAQGVDIWAAEAVLELRDASHLLELHIFRPFPSQSSNWPKAAQERYQRILERADYVKDVCDDPPAAWKYQKRNECMMNHSLAVIAVWDGSDGGTANCLKYNRTVGLPVLRINPQSREARWIR